MEIFRTDGGGKSANDERLSRLLVEFCKVAPEWVNDVTEIRDHKGTLMITIDENNYDKADLFFHLFSYLWYNQCEYLVQIYINDVCVKGYNKGDYYGR